MFSNDLPKVRTSIKLQLSVINCARPVFEHVVFQVWKNKIIKTSCWQVESPETFVGTPQKLEVSNRTIRHSQVFLRF
jgi:hypothetical protein